MIICARAGGGGDHFVVPGPRRGPGARPQARLPRRLRTPRTATGKPPFPVNRGDINGAQRRPLASGRSGARRASGLSWPVLSGVCRICRCCRMCSSWCTARPSTTGPPWPRYVTPLPSLSPTDRPPFFTPHAVVSSASHSPSPLCVCVCMYPPGPGVVGRAARGGLDPAPPAPQHPPAPRPHPPGLHRTARGTDI